MGTLLICSVSKGMGRSLCKLFVPTTTYLGIIEAYIHPAPGGSGCFKARANGPVAV